MSRLGSDGYGVKSDVMFELYLNKGNKGQEMGKSWGRGGWEEPLISLVSILSALGCREVE